MNRSHLAVLVRLAMRSGRGQPGGVGAGNMVRHDSGGNDVVLEGRLRQGFRDAGQYPEERRAEVALRFQPHAARPVTGNECLDLDVNEARSAPVTAKNVHVWGVAQRHNGGVASAAQLPGHKELARVSPKCLVVFHDLLADP